MADKERGTCPVCGGESRIDHSPRWDAGPALGETHPGCAAKRDGEGRLEIRERILDCTACELVAHCKAPVPFSGPTPASLAVLGEAPGVQEDTDGQPFIGPAGKLIREHLGAVGIDPAGICFVNTVSCFPREIRTPTREHVAACEANKLAQLRLISPTWLLVLGKVASQSFRPELKIGEIRGRPFTPPALAGLGDPAVGPGTVAFATFHPAAALRNRLYEQEMHRDLERFVELVQTGPQWWQSIGETCVLCEEPWVWLDEALPFCEQHAGGGLQTRLEALDEDYRACLSAGDGGAAPSP